MELVTATSNRHKFREIRSLLADFEIDLFSLADFPDYIQPGENGQSFEENAILKATHASSALQMWVIADDSGLVVPALQGRPGIFSRRYAGPSATDLENRRKLLKEMAGFTDIERAAYYECALAIAGPDGLKKCVRASCEGRIATVEKGSNGFGYDALFIKNDYKQTFAQLDDGVKNQVSHRAKAYGKLLPLLEALIVEISTNK